jgi:hypothetical protein
MREGGIKTGKRPGVLLDAFEHRKYDVNAPTFLGKFGNFIEPEYLRQNLYDYGIANGTGHADPGLVDAAILDA